MLVQSELAPSQVYPEAGGQADSGDRRGGWGRASAQAASPLGLLWITPFAIAAVYLCVLVVKIPHDTRTLAWVSDYASGFTLPETVAQVGSGGHTLLASSGQWVSLWFGLLTASLPLHRELWTLAPTALLVISALVIGWSVAQIAPRRVAVLAVLLVVVASPLALKFFMAAVAHNALYPCTAFAGAYLVWLTRGQDRPRAIVFAVPPLAGIALGACLASDLLVGAAVVAPLLLTGVLAGLRRNRRSRVVACSALSTAIVALPIAKLTAAIMHSSGFVTIVTPAKLAPLAELEVHARLLFKGLEALFDGNLSEVAPGTLHAELGFACVIVMVLALLALAVFGVVTGARFLRSGLRDASQETPVQLAYSLHVIYWFSSAVAVCLAFWLTAETGTSDAHESYYGTAIFSVAAVVPLLMAKSSLARRLVIVGASVFFLANFLGLKGNFPAPLPSVASYETTITKLAKENHATYGYAGYWNASSLTWNSDYRVTVRPLMECPNPAGASICPFYIMRSPAWYVPKQRKTFLLVDKSESWLSALPPGLGRPVAAYAFGPIQMYVYSYDIASRFGAPLT